MSIASTLVQVGSPCDQPGVRLVERVPVDTLTKIFRGEQPVAYSTETDRRALRSLHHHIGRGSGEHTVEYAFDHTNHYTKLTTAAPSLARLDPATRALLCGDTTQCIIMDTFVPRIVDQLARHYGHSSESLARHLEAPHGAIDSMLFRTFPPTKARDPVIHAIHQFVYGKLVPEVKAAFPQMWAVSSRRTRNAEAHLLATVCAAIESAMVMSAIRFCTAHNIQVAVVIDKGVMVYRSEETAPSFLLDLTGHVLKETGFDVPWAFHAAA